MRIGPGASGGERGDQTERRLHIPSLPGTPSISARKYEGQTALSTRRHDAEYLEVNLYARQRQMQTTTVTVRWQAPKQVKVVSCRLGLPTFCDSWTLHALYRMYVPVNKIHWSNNSFNQPGSANFLSIPPVPANRLPFFSRIQCSAVL